MRTAVLAILVGIALWVVWIYNRLVTLRNQVENAWKQIDVQLKRRHDLVPNLVAAVRGMMEFERDTLERVIAARARAAGAKGVHDSIEAENQLTGALRQLFAVVERYPELKSSENVLRLQEELTTTENQIGFTRQHYNDVVMRYNTQQQVFPANFVASQFAFQPAEPFTAAETDRATPTVDLSLRT